MEPMPNTLMSEREQYLMKLLKRLLRLYEKQRVQLDNATRLIHRLQETCQALQEQLERAEANHATEITTTDIFCGAAIDELLAG